MKSYENRANIPNTRWQLGIPASEQAFEIIKRGFFEMLQNEATTFRH
jgi:hypothetical protein